ncbi:MAG: cytochrome c peroxidase [Myxococcota bacterium]
MRLSAVCLALLAGCGEALPAPEAADVAGLAHAQGQGLSGKQLFEQELFQGNGRVCATCHLEASGAIGPDDIEAAWQADPGDPLFRALDSDDGTGASYDRLRTDATFRIRIDLPPNVTLVDDPSATQVELFRGASTVVNNPGLEVLFMQDGRNATLQEQALGAVNAHFEPGRQPTVAELDAIAQHEQTKDEFYSSNAMKQWERTGRPVSLPPGTTPEEIRGAAWFDSSSPDGVCAHCHSGPYLNETGVFLQAPLPPGSRFFTALVSEFNTAGTALQTFAFADPSDPSAPPVIVESPDPGRALITGDPNDANFFRIPTVWGAVDTAPYFHDNSAADLQALMDHYQAYFQVVIGLTLTEQDKADIIAYLQLLR